MLLRVAVGILRLRWRLHLWGWQACDLRRWYRFIIGTTGAGAAGCALLVSKCFTRPIISPGWNGYG